MNPTSEPADPLKPEPTLAVTPSPQPTPPAISETPPDSAPPSTRSMHPTVSLSISNAEATAPALQPGADLDGYVLLEQIGRGGMGVVFKARQPNSEQTVAIKVLRDSLFADDEAHDRLLQEVRAMGRLQSVKNIVPIFHVGQYRGCFFLVMPFLPGGTLSSRRKSFPFAAPAAVALIEKVARAVDELHKQKILHRDIKPGNILLDAADEPHLSDFGLAKLLDQEQSLTGSQQRLGTPAYMAPEQTGLLPIPMSPQTDIWALGVVLYELLVGKRPFIAADDEVSSTLLWKIVHEVPPRPRTLQPNLDPGLEAVILKCLEKQPSDRYASAAELADELARWLRQEKLKTPPVSLGTRMRRFARQRPRLVRAAAILAVIGLAAAAVAFEFRRRNSPEYVHETIRDELLGKGSVVLIGERGPPKWFHSTFGGRMITGIDHDGYWRIDSPENWGMVELLRNVPLERYKLHAEICHLKSEPINGRVGIFLGHHTYVNGPNMPRFWALVGFNDVIVSKPPEQLRKLNPMPAFPKGNSAEIWWEAYSNNDVPAIYRRQGPAVLFEAAGSNKATLPWRRLEMELHPDVIAGSFEGKPFRSQDRALVENDIHDRMRAEIPAYPSYVQFGDFANLRLASNGSVGLVVRNSSILVRNVTLARIANPE